MDSNEYQKTLETNLKPVFSISDTAVHMSNSTIKWLAEKNIACLVWPSISSDLNIMENVWGYYPDMFTQAVSSSVTKSNEFRLFNKNRISCHRKT